MIYYMLVSIPIPLRVRKNKETFLYSMTLHLKNKLVFSITCTAAILCEQDGILENKHTLIHEHNMRKEIVKLKRQVMKSF